MSIRRPRIAPPVSRTTYSPEYPPAACTRIREPSGSTVGSAATIPLRGIVPDAVGCPVAAYAVAVKGTVREDGGSGSRRTRRGRNDALQLNDAAANQQTMHRTSHRRPPHRMWFLPGRHPFVSE